MTFSSSLMYAKSLIFPKAEKRSSARRSLFGALLCIGLSIVPLVVVISITNGMINGMTERIIGLSSSHLQAYISSALKNVQTAEDFLLYAKDLEELDGILHAYPEVGISALAAGKSYRTGAQIRAMQQDIFQTNPSFSKLFTVNEGSTEAFATGDGKVAIIGQKMANTLQLHAGDTFRIITTRNNGGKITPKLTSFKVAAVVTSGYQELDELWVFVPIETAYTFIPLSNASFTVMMETPDAFAPDLVRIQKNVSQFIGRYANVYRWDQVHSGEFENFSSTKVMLVFVMMLIVLVATVNVSSAIVMLVMERRKEIAILKSIGASPSGITFSFLLTGMACGCGGVILGLPVGLLLSVNANAIVSGLEKSINWLARIVYYLKGTPVDEATVIKLMDPQYYLQVIPVDIPFNQIFLIVASTILLSLIVSIVPSIRAGKEKPLDILRKN